MEDMALELEEQRHHDAKMAKRTALQEHIDCCWKLLAYLESRHKMRDTTVVVAKEIESLRKVLEALR